jgi:hypothetical protein
MNFQKNMIKYVKSNFYENLVLILVLLPFLTIIFNYLINVLTEDSLQEFVDISSLLVISVVRAYYNMVRNGFLIGVNQIQLIYSIYVQFYSNLMSDLKDSIVFFLNSTLPYDKTKFKNYHDYQLYEFVKYIYSPIQESLVSLVQWSLFEQRGTEPSVSSCAQ